MYFIFSKGSGQCLEDEPDLLERYKYPDLPAGVMYDANYQCRLQFGQKAILCTPPDEICLHLWCSINTTCTTLLRPAAEGTNCGKHKVIIILLMLSYTLSIFLLI